MFLFYVNPILIAAAVIPAIVLLRFVYKEDRLDKESPRLLLSLVLFGIIATFAALISEQIGETVLALIVPQDTTAYNAILYFIVVALSEEGFKYLLLKKRTWWSSEFNCQFDGVVYAVFVSLGFALWENISYVAMYGLGTAAVRAVTAVPGHACFGVFMGAFTALPSATITSATRAAAASAAVSLSRCPSCSMAATISSRPMNMTATRGCLSASLCCFSLRLTA